MTATYWILTMYWALYSISFLFYVHECFAFLCIYVPHVCSTGAEERSLLELWMVVSHVGAESQPWVLWKAANAMITEPFLQPIQ